MKFTNYLTESGDVVAFIKRIIKNKHYEGVAKAYDNTLYFEFADLQGAIRLQRSLANKPTADDVRAHGAGKIGTFDLMPQAILSVGEIRHQDNPPSVEMHIEFRDDIPKEAIQAAKADVVSDADVKKEANRIRDNY